jgi:phage shock protein PspC (stress-responsive transcriptional regulator)
MTLKRSADDKVIAGVCGGIAKAIGVSSKNVRIGFVLLVLLFGLSLWTYIIAWIFIPKEIEYSID